MGAITLIPTSPPLIFHRIPTGGGVLLENLGGNTWGISRCISLFWKMYYSSLVTICSSWCKCENRKPIYLNVIFKPHVIQWGRGVGRKGGYRKIRKWKGGFYRRGGRGVGTTGKLEVSLKRGGGLAYGGCRRG